VLEGRDLPSGAHFHPSYVLYRPATLTPAGSSGPWSSAFSPAGIDSAYAINQAVIGDGTGQTIAIIDAYNNPSFVSRSTTLPLNQDTNFLASDLHKFDVQYGLPEAAGFFTKVNQNGGTSYPGTDPAGAGNPNGNWEAEEALDVEWAHALAPGAHILLVEATDDSDNLFLAAQWAANSSGAHVVSMSWGSNEFSGEQSYDSTYFANGATHGVTFLASTGDGGQPSGYPAFSPDVVGVGGTTLTISGSKTGSNTYTSESGWSGSGGSISTQESQPSYQNGLVIHNGSQIVSANGRRANPDISFDADPGSGVSVYDSYNGNVTGGPWYQFGGTSLSAPCWAALIAIADQLRAAQSLGSLSGLTQTLPKLYALSSGDYHDVTTGNNGFAAGTGYDLVTGIGTPIVSKLVPDLAGVTPPAFTSGSPPTSVTAGQTYHFTFTASGTNVTLSASNLPAWLTFTPATGVLTGSSTIAATYTNLQVTASNAAGSVTQTFNVTVNPAAANHLVVSAPASAVANNAFNITVTAQDQFNNTATSYGGTVGFKSSDNSATLPGNHTLTNGVGTFGVTLHTGGNQTVTATDTVSSSITGTSGTIAVSAPATHVVFLTQPSNTGATATLSPAVHIAVEDSLGNVVSTDASSVTLAIGTNAGGGTLSGTLTVAAVSGVATFSTLSINKSGAGYTLTASDGSLTGATSSSFTISPGAASHLAFGVQPATTTAGVTLAPALTALVEDSAGNVVTSDSSTVSMALGSNPGGSTLSGITTAAASSGVATFSTLWLNKSGTGYVLVAADGSLTGATSSAFNITPGSVIQIVFGTQPNTAAVGQAIAPAVTVRIEDNLGNVVTTDTSSVSLALGSNPGGGTLGGTVTVAASGGVATFSTLSVNKIGSGYTLTAADGNLAAAPSNTFNIIPGPPTHLVFAVQPGNTTAGATISPALTVKVEDNLGNVVTGDSSNVTLGLGTNAGGGTLGGTVTVAASNGVASFTTLSINKAANGYTLTAADGSLASATSSSFNIAAGSATQVAFGAGPSNTPAGQIIAPALTVQVEDSLGNLVSSDGSSVTLALGANAAGGTLAGTVTVAAVSGVATFSTLSINRSGSGYTLTAADGGLLGATSNAFAITPGTATQLVFGVQPSNSVAGQHINPAVTVQVEDSLGNVATTDNSTLTVALASNPGGGALGGTASMAAVSGIATFGTLTLVKTGLGYTLTAADGSLASATSAAFNVTAVASQLVFTTQPSNTTAGATVAPAVQVAVEDSLGNLVTGDGSSITLALGNNPGGGTLNGTLTASAVGGVATFANLSVNQTGTGYTLTAADESLTGATSSAFNIVYAPVDHLALTLTSANVTAGAAFNVTVTAEDASNNTVPTYTGTIHFTSSDPQAPVPAGDLSITNGVGQASAVLDTAGGQTIAATDTKTPSLTATSGTLTVSATAASQLILGVPASTITGSTFAVVVTAEDPFKNVATGYAGTVTLSSSDAAAAFAPSSYTFTSGDAGVHTLSATLNTPGNQTITATDTSFASITGTSAAISAAGLRVVSVTPQPYGFTVIFNKSFDPGTLNLFDGGSHPLGAPDLTLVGAHAALDGTPGPIITGSVIVGATNNSLTYLYTYGMLPDDTYTLTLHSGATAFHDAGGFALDGNNSGVPGTDYSTTFTTSYNANAVGLVVPSFARGPGQSVNLVVPASNPSAYYGGIPIELTDGDNASTASFSLTYSTALLNINGAMVDPGAPAGSTFVRTSHTVNKTFATDVFTFSTNSSATLGTGNGPVVLGELSASVPNTPGQTIYHSKRDLHVMNVTVNGVLPGVGVDGLQLVAYPADASGDGSYSGNDAALVGRVAGGQDSGFIAYPLVDPVIVADVAGDGTVTASDASQVAQAGVHRNVPNITPIPSGAQVLPTTAPDPALSMPQILPASPGGIVTVPVNLDDPHPAGSTGLDEATLGLRFDPHVFTVSPEDIHLGSIPSSGNGWTLTAVVDDATGQLAITLYSLTPITTTTAGSLVTIDFHERAAAGAGATTIYLAATVNPGGQGEYRTGVADEQGAMILTPTPGAGPTVAGLSTQEAIPKYALDAYFAALGGLSTRGAGPARLANDVTFLLAKHQASGELNQ
jgi:hypothetical protein